MILIQNSSSSANELKSLAMQGIYDEGVRLKPTSEFSIVGNNKIEGFYEGNFNGSNVNCFAIGLINSKGSGFSILVLTTLQAFTDTHISGVKKLGSSVEFFESSDIQMTLKWKQQIVNTQLKYMSTYTSTDYSGGVRRHLS